MGQSGFGVLVQKLRESRGLSLRELMQLADIDHAYIYRLETGDKESPSEEVVTKLGVVRSKRASARLTCFVILRSTRRVIPSSSPMS